MRICIFILSMAFSLLACADEQEGQPAPPPATAKVYAAGKDYEVIDIPVSTITPGKIEVTEVFWYGCGHCNHFEPTLNDWGKGLADDVQLVKSPAIWRPNMEAHARIFYTAQALGILEDVHPKVFDAMHNQRIPLNTEEQIMRFFEQFGVTNEDFSKVYNSFAVSSQIQQAGARARSFRITGTPEMVVDGRFRISSKLAGSQEGMLKVADYLIEQIRDKKI